MSDLVLTSDEPVVKKFTTPFSALTDGHDEWLTPRYITDALGEFDTDPCSPIVRPWPTAKNHFTRLDNGLVKEWHGRVWLNPPYGTETGKWLGRLAEHGDGIAFIFARTETGMFFRHVWPVADAILFLEGRVTFCKVDGSEGKSAAGAPSCLIAYGGGNSQILKTCTLPGRYIQLK